MTPARLRRSVAPVAWIVAVPAAALWACSSNEATSADSDSNASNQTTTDAGSAAAPADASTAEDAPTDADAGSPFACPAPTNDAPQAIECTGLYSDLALKTIASGLRTYAPSTPLWSDGAEKTRWVYLPPGTTIDGTNPLEWKFPIGTKLWKEFALGGKRVETRFFHKIGQNLWIHASYRWASDELTATRADGADFEANGAAYHIPTPSECDKCHNGRADRILGFSAVSLGLGNATGTTLESLSEAGLLAPAPTTTSYAIGDDGTGGAAKALAWLDVNCGVTCHNDNTTATAYPTGLRLRLDPKYLDGSAPTSAWQPFATTLGVLATTPKWAGAQRIVPGDPDASLLVRLISQRGTDQMPPVGTNLVDDADVANVRAWIAAMAPLDGGTSDGGAPDAAPPVADSGSDAAADAGGDAGDGGQADLDAGDAGVAIDAGM